MRVALVSTGAPEDHWHRNHRFFEPLYRARWTLLRSYTPLTSEAPDKVDLAALEADFIEHAWNYSQSKGITRAAWRSVGVPANVLSAAGL